MCVQKNIPYITHIAWTQIQLEIKYRIYFTIIVFQLIKKKSIFPIHVTNSKQVWSEELQVEQLSLLYLVKDVGPLWGNVLTFPNNSKTWDNSGYING